MTGKAYTMIEMKAIVDYLVDHKAFGEIRGRKMWIDFATSKKTTRTWQSLKETFLKRILPDIQNPYYKLSLIEIGSFKQGIDIKSKLDNKLELEPVENVTSPGPSKENGANQNQKDGGDKVQEKNNIDEEVSGEDGNIFETLNNIKASSETLVQPYYNTTDEILKELDNDFEESIPESKKDDENESKPPQELDQVKNVSTSDTQNVDGINDAIEISDSEDIIIGENATAKANKKIEKKKNNTENDSKNDNDSSKNHVENKENPEKDKKCTPNSLNSTTDTQLPNNPEGLQKSPKGKSFKKNVLLRNNRKRNIRAESEGPITKSKKSKQQSVSDTDARMQTNFDYKMEVLNKEKQQEEAVNKINLESDVHTEIPQEDIADNEEAENKSPDSQVKSNDGSLDIDTNTNQNVTTNDVLAVQIQKTAESENPRPKSVNSYKEQLSCTIYSGTENEQKEKNKELPKKTDTPQESALSSGATDLSNGNKASMKIDDKKRRDNALSRAMGFSTILSNRKRSQSYSKRRSGSHHKTVNISSSSSDTSCDSESDYAASPRGGIKKGNGKYLKPQSHRIVNLGEKGFLFAVIGKKIYPIVKDKKHSRNYINYSSEEEQESESFWKLKYVDEKKKAAELAKQLVDMAKSKTVESSVVPATMTNQEIIENMFKDNGKDEVCRQTAVPESKAVDSQRVQLKIINKDEIVQVEGSWSCMNPLLQQIVLQRQNNTEHDYQSTSAGSSAAAKRVDDIEKEIFKEIAELEEIEKSKRESVETDADSLNSITNSITTRKPVKKKNFSVSNETASPKKANGNGENTEIRKSKKRIKNKVTTRRSTRSTKKRENDADSVDLPAKKTLKKESGPGGSPSRNEDEDVFYKFPSPTRATYRGRRAPPSTYTINARIYSSPDHLSLYSEETQGYIDSEQSPIVCLRKKKYITARKRSIPNITEDFSSESNFSLDAPFVTQTFTNSSVSSHMYRSESYQLLVPKTAHAPNQLERIEEHLTTPNKSTYEHDETEVSLPTSPVLSIVEHNSINSNHSGSENYIDDLKQIVTLNSLMPETVDVSMPLLVSNYLIKEKTTDGNNFNYSLYDRSTSNSIINKETAQTDDISKSMRQKFDKLVIESAKKNAPTALLMNDEEMPTVEKPVRKRGRKISSTPRKRQSARKSKSQVAEPCIEEHTEFCSRAGRPQVPLLEITPAAPEMPPREDENTIKAKLRVAKDIIKVKLPKVIRRRKSDPAFTTDGSDAKNGAGDAESGIFLHSNESVDLMHNHSDTCCTAHLRVDSSGDCVPPSADSFLMAGSSPADKPSECSNVALEMMSQNAQDATELTADFARRPGSGTANSLLTEDLSEESSKSPSWYLYDEEETFFREDRDAQRRSVGSTLNAIFPVTCAVPDLSTITEASKDEKLY